MLSARRARHESRWSACSFLIVLLASILGTVSGHAQQTGSVEQDREVLMILYNEAGGPNWLNKNDCKDNWGSSKPLGEWGRTITDENSGRVIAIGLTECNLAGTLPKELGNLTELTDLYLNHGGLTGPIPKELGNLPKLEQLILNDNRLTGPLPKELGNLPKLRRFSFGDNQLTGEIPKELGNLPELFKLSGYNNQLTGPIPKELGNLLKLTDLFLNHNRLTGPIPKELGNLLKLKHLTLNDNRLTGEIPKELGNLPELTNLHLNDNRLTGPIPKELGNLELRDLYLAGNASSLCLPSSLQTWYESTPEKDRVPICHSGGGSSGGSSGGSRPPADRHGNTPSRATSVPLSATAPWGSSTTGRINTTRDIDYFALTLPHAGVLLVETLGSTDTVGTVWQDGEELATKDSGGVQQNFLLSVRVEAGPVVLAVAGNGTRTGAYTLKTTLVAGYLENPGPDSFQSGIGVLSGWVCEAEDVEIELTHGSTGTVETYRAGYGTIREDTVPVCGDTDNGFGFLWNWNLLGDGTHRVRVLVDGVELGEASVAVTTLGEEFARGLSGSYPVAAFPSAGEQVHLHWSQAQQNFVLGPATPPRVQGASWPGDPQTGLLENPAPNSLQSGVSVISGWVCEATVVEIALTNETTGEVQTYQAATGTIREDTAPVCGDTDNGFGFLWNWNLLEDGAHTVRAFADGQELGYARVVVTTLGEEFARGLSGRAELADFPSPGQTVTVEWQQTQQNFVITAVTP